MLQISQRTGARSERLRVVSQISTHNRNTATTYDQREVIMKTHLRISVVSLFAVLSLTMTAVPALGQLTVQQRSTCGQHIRMGDRQWLRREQHRRVHLRRYGHQFHGRALGPPRSAADRFGLVDHGHGERCRGDGGHYNFVGIGTDLQYWGLANGSIGSGGSTGLACPPQPFGCDLYEATVNIPGGVPLNAGTYWLNLQNATATAGPVGWDENDGPNSVASQNTLGTIGSEDPDFYGTPNGPTPEPGSVVLVGLGAPAWRDCCDDGSRSEARVCNAGADTRRCPLYEYEKEIYERRANCIASVSCLVLEIGTVLSTREYGYTRLSDWALLTLRAAQN